MESSAGVLLGGRGGTCSDGRPAVLELMKHKLRLRRNHQKHATPRFWIPVSLQKCTQSLLLQNAQLQKSLYRCRIDRKWKTKLVAVHNHLANLRLLLVRHIQRMLRETAIHHVGAHLQ